MSSDHKRALFQALRNQIEEDLRQAVTAQEEAQRDATHAEAKQENDKDTRALETTYLARGLAQRVADLKEARARLIGFSLRDFSADDAITGSALVSLEDEEGEVRHFFLAPTGGGIKIQWNKKEVAVVTPQSPLGKALVGRQVGDVVEIHLPQGKREAEVLTLQ